MYSNVFIVRDKKTKMMYTLTARYTSNNTCILEVDGKKFTSAGGGGYDKVGSCIGTWIAETFPERLKRLDSTKNYGLKYYQKQKVKVKRLKRWPKSKRQDPHYWLLIDGACGLNSMLTILKNLGCEVI
jgi:hypothetical protein